MTRAQVAEVGMVDAGHRSPCLVNSLQVVLIDGISDVRIIKIRIENAQRVLVKRQTDFLGIVECLRQNSLVLPVIDGDTIDGHISDDGFLVQLG